jgi:hypothetical protein
MQISDVIARRYELREALGGGGLGRVFRAFDERALREVAVKVLDAARCPADAVGRYLALAGSAARAKHPAIVPQRVQAAADGAPPVAVSELLAGEDLDALRGRVGALPWRRAAEIVATCAEALTALATATGAAHRGLKPGNVRVDASGEVRLLDFGGAELGVQPVPPRGEVHVEYRAPEQLEGSPGDARSDVFTLGVLLFEMVSGVHPFSGPSTFKVMHKVLLQPAPRPGEVAPGVPLPATVEALLARALARRPADRFADPAELGKMLTLVRRAAGAEAAPAAAPRPALPIVAPPDDDASSIVAPTQAEDLSTVLRGLPAAEAPSAVPAAAPIVAQEAPRAAAPIVAQAAPIVAQAAPRAAAPIVAQAAPRAAAPIVVAPIAGFAGAPAPSEGPPLLVDNTEVLPIKQPMRLPARVAVVSAGPGARVASVQEADDRTEVVPLRAAPAPLVVPPAPDMDETIIVAAVEKGEEDSTAVVALVERAARAPEEPTQLLAGPSRAAAERGASAVPAVKRERSAPERTGLPGAQGPMKHLVVLNIVLIVLALAGVAWVVLG